MHHNERIRQAGICKCPCHIGAQACICQLSQQIRDIINPKRRKLRNGKLTSRVRAFSGARLKKGGRGRLPIAIKEHGYHALIQGRIT